MSVNKPHLEFHRVDMNSGWSTPSGYPAGRLIPLSQVGQYVV